MALGIELKVLYLFEFGRISILAKIISKEGTQRGRRDKTKATHFFYEQRPVKLVSCKTRQFFNENTWFIRNRVFSEYHGLLREVTPVKKQGVCKEFINTPPKRLWAGGNRVPSSWTESHMTITCSLS